MQVVRNNVRFEERAREGEERVLGVVHAAEEHRLIEGGNAQFLQGADRGDDVGIELARVVDVEDEEDRLGAGCEEGEEGGVEALGDADGKASVESDAADVRDGRDVGEEGGEAVVGE